MATRLGSFGFFIGVWVVMMAAMMLPGVAPAAPSWPWARSCCPPKPPSMCRPALAIVALGTWIVLVPSSVPGLVPAM